MLFLWTLPDRKHQIKNTKIDKSFWKSLPLIDTYYFKSISSEKWTRKIYSLLNYIKGQGRSQGGGGMPQVHVHPPFKKKPTKQKLYFLCRIIRFYTNNPKCQYAYLSFYLNIIFPTGSDIQSWKRIYI